jgi:ankyrin repeat protein
MRFVILISLTIALCSACGTTAEQKQASIQQAIFERNNAEVVRLLNETEDIAALLKSEESPSFDFPKDKCTPIEVALCVGNPQALTALLDHGASIKDPQIFAEHSALSIIFDRYNIFRGDVQGTLEVLLNRYGYEILDDPETRDKALWHMLYEKMSVDFIRATLEQKPELLNPSEAKTILSTALRREDRELIQLLFEYGATPEAVYKNSSIAYFPTKLNPEFYKTMADMGFFDSELLAKYGYTHLSGFVESLVSESKYTQLKYVLQPSAPTLLQKNERWAIELLDKAVETNRKERRRDAVKSAISRNPQQLDSTTIALATSGIEATDLNEQQRLETISVLLDAGAVADYCVWMDADNMMLPNVAKSLEEVVVPGRNDCPEFPETHPLAHAIASGNLKMVEKTSKSEALLNKKPAFWQATPLDLVGLAKVDEETQIAMATILIKAGAKSGKEFTALAGAAAQGNIKVMAALKDLGLSINGDAGNLTTPLIEAICGEKEEAINWLVEQGADVNKKSDDGLGYNRMTPLGHLLELKEDYDPQVYERVHSLLVKYGAKLSGRY